MCQDWNLEWWTSFPECPSLPCSALFLTSLYIFFHGTSAQGRKTVLPLILIILSFSRFLSFLSSTQKFGALPYVEDGGEEEDSTKPHELLLMASILLLHLCLHHHPSPAQAFLMQGISADEGHFTKVTMVVNSFIQYTY